MKIFEVAASTTPSPIELMGLVRFLVGRAQDTNARMSISKTAFIEMAQSLDINVNENNIEEIVGQPPLSSLLEPLTPDSQDLVFKGAGEPEAPKTMPVNKAQDIVAAAAKSAMNRDRGV